MARNKGASGIALAGVTAALAVVVMCLGTLIPVATFVCPMIVLLTLELVRRSCGSRLAWAWYGAVAVLSLLLAPDKEAAVLLVVLGYYPMVKPRLDTLPLKWLWKLLLFNASIALMYGLLLRLMGLEQLTEEVTGLGTVMTVLTLVLGNVTFLALDYLLSRNFVGRRK